MRGPASQQPDPTEHADDDAEREVLGVSAEAWGDAFAWADDSGGTPGAGADDPLPDGGPMVEPFGVWRCHWDTVTCFLACETQWRMAPMGGALGLEYPGVEVVMRRRRVADKFRMFEALQLMEVAALEVLRG